jgi:hypothetical protein
MDILVSAFWTGAGATVLTDAWCLLRRHWFAVPFPDYALVGRWFGHLPRGRFVHAAIAASAPVRGERVLGWAMHYLIGIVFALALYALADGGAGSAPTLGEALAVGIGSVLAPFLILHPGLGLGVAAWRAPQPWRARGHSLMVHAVFGLGLYLSAQVLHRLASS